MLIEYATTSERKFYKDAGVSITGNLEVGFGGSATEACSFVTDECQQSGDLGLGIGAFNFKLDIGIDGQYDVATGKGLMGEHRGVGPCSLFVNLGQISVDCMSLE